MNISSYMIDYRKEEALNTTQHIKDSNLFIMPLSKIQKEIINNTLNKSEFKIEIDNFNFKKVQRKSIKYIKKETYLKKLSSGIIKKFIINHIRHKYTNYNQLINKIENNPNWPSNMKNEAIKKLKKRINNKIKKLL